MRRRSPPRLDAAAWEASLLSADTEALLAAVRNYLGPIKTPYDKRTLVSRLSAFLRKPETLKAVLGLIDLLDARILGALLFLGAATEAELRGLFTGELPLFDFGLRLANLQDRLLLFRFEAGRESLLAVNPLLAEEIRGAFLDPALQFGPETGSWENGPSGPAPSPAGLDAALVVAFFGFLFHTPGSLRKGGGLTKRGKERAALLLPELGRGAGRFDSLAAALFAAGAIRRQEGGEAETDTPAFSGLLKAWDWRLPYYLAAALAAGESGEGRGPAQGPGGGVDAFDQPSVDAAAALLARALGAFPPGLRLSRGGLGRWLGLLGLRDFPGEEFPPIPALIEALEALGLIHSAGTVLIPTPSPRPAPPKAARAPVLVAEGSHLFHLLPEASLEERLYLLLLSEARSVGKAWSLEIDRESARRGFSAGLGAAAMLERLTRMAGRPLPQSLVFSIKAWEEEFTSLRLYHGFVLAADERLRNIVDGSGPLASLIAERLGPGLYLLAARSYEEAASRLAAAGLEAPPETRGSPPFPGGGAEGPRDSPAAAAAAAGSGRASDPSAEEGPEEGGYPWESGSSAQVAAVAEASAEASAKPGALRFPDPRPLLAELRSALEARGELSPERRRELSDRIDRRLILGVEQLELAELRVERLEAAGLDYLGKVRVVERALRGRGDRLEILYRLPGADPVRVLLRPVRLDKTEKGLVLEAEDLGTGGPVRVPLGAASLVRRLRASLFGEDT